MLSKTPSGLDNYEEYHVIYSASKDSKITKVCIIKIRLFVFHRLPCKGRVARVEVVNTIE